MSAESEAQFRGEIERLIHERDKERMARLAIVGARDAEKQDRLVMLEKLATAADEPQRVLPVRDESMRRIYQYVPCMHVVRCAADPVGVRCPACWSADDAHSNVPSEGWRRLYYIVDLSP